jgi:hypothetical protein
VIPCSYAYTLHPELFEHSSRREGAVTVIPIIVVGENGWDLTPYLIAASRG